MAKDRDRRTSRLRRMLTAGAVGAVISYLFDPDRGRGRRVRLREKATKLIRRTGRRGGRMARRARGNAYGRWQRATHPVQENPPMDDATLKQKVETGLFGRPDVSKGKLAVNVEQGLVILRGQVDGEVQMKELARAALAVPGVVGVQNLLHLPGEPAPNKQSAERASDVAGNGGDARVG